jgi:hypothetical protein
MEILFAKELTVPLYQAGLLLALSTLALFLGKLRIALIINYLYVLYWVYWLNREVILGKGTPALTSSSLVYFGFGIVVVILALIGLLNRPN